MPTIVSLLIFSYFSPLDASVHDSSALAPAAAPVRPFSAALPARPEPAADMPQAIREARDAIWGRFERQGISVFEAIDALDHASALSEDGRKNGGVVYTPPTLARSMCEILSPAPTARLLEPSCGRGVFVFSVLEWMSDAMGWGVQEAAEWGEAHLFASELDEQALADLAHLWRLYFHARGVQSDLAANGNLRAGDALFGGFSQERFDAVLGNPPYVRIQNLSSDLREKIQASFSSCAKGNVDLFYAFCQQALEIADRVCFVVPNSLFSNASAKALRAQLAPRLKCAIDFGSRLIFAPTRAYSCVFLAERASQRHPFVFWRSNLPEEGGKWLAAPTARFLARKDRFAFLPTSPSMAADRLGHGRPDHAGNGAAFAAGDSEAADAGATTGGSSAPQTLGDIAEVFAGVATLSDASFLLPPGAVESAPGGPVWAYRDPKEGVSGSVRRIPLSLAPRFFKLTKAKDAQSLTDPLGLRIACPYDDAWKALPEQQLPPDLLAWLAGRKEALLARDKGKTEGYEAWFGYGRRQGFQTFSPQDDLLFIAGMAHGPLDPLAVKAAALGERFLFASGFALRPRAGFTAAQVDAFLRSPGCWEQIRREGRAWAGGKDYRTFGARLLRGLRL